MIVKFVTVAHVRYETDAIPSNTVRLVPFFINTPDIRSEAEARSAVWVQRLLDAPHSKRLSSFG